MREFEMIYRDDVSPTAISLFQYLVERSGCKGYCWPSINTIAHEIKRCRTTVKKALRELERKGYLDTEQQRRANGSKTSSIYRIKTPKQYW
jgi:DNA-binding transcriptional regulator YhcF (GntR family)